MTDEYKKYLKSEEWRQLRIDLYDFRGSKCEKCGSTKNLQVHHKHYSNIFNEEPEDLIVLCSRCHAETHGLIKPKKDKKKYKKAKKKKKFVTNLSRREELKLEKENPKAYARYINKLKVKYEV